MYALECVHRVCVSACKASVCAHRECGGDIHVAGAWGGGKQGSDRTGYCRPSNGTGVYPKSNGPFPKVFKQFVRGGRGQSFDSLLPSAFYVSLEEHITLHCFQFLPVSPARVGLL